MVLMLKCAYVWTGNSNIKNFVYAYDDYEPKNYEFLNDVKGFATSTEFKGWIKSEYALKVLSLYVAQVKNKCALEKCLNYNMGENKSCVPKCSLKKEKVIMVAFRHFNMIWGQSLQFSRKAEL